jgi:pimeloyl-ACP methyl ester carboxylesterase
MSFTAETGFLGPAGARLYKVIMPGVAHMGSMEQPEIFNRTVLAFLVAQ